MNDSKKTENRVETGAPASALTSGGSKPKPAEFVHLLKFQ